ncbi:MFS transporter [Kribbella capetownensis]|nr:MFS transporter [Kribbella capetownensis]
MRKVVTAGLLGTSLETYDLYLYGTASATIFPRLFFTNQSDTVATILSLATFGVSFMARPLGAIIFGHFGDRIGRKETLITTLLLMGVSTAVIGALPTYDSIGALAPVVLVLLRLLQGVGFGGEYSGAVLMLSEHAPAGRRGFYAGLNNIGPVFGFILSTLVFLVTGSLMSDATFTAWGWRIPFLLSAVLVAVGLYVRNQLSESSLFIEAVKKRESATPPLLQVVRRHPKELILGTGSTVALFAIFYLFSTYTLSYATKVLQMDRSTVLWSVILAMVVNGVAIPLAASLSDRVGRRAVCVAGLAAAALWAFPMFSLINTGNSSLLTLALSVQMVFYGVIYAPIAALLSEIFTTSVRFTGAALSYNLGGILGAAFAPIIASALLARYGNTDPIALYIIAMCVISAVCVAALRETRLTNLAEPR